MFIFLPISSVLACIFNIYCVMTKCVSPWYNHNGWQVPYLLAVTCHLHFGQNDWDLLRATNYGNTGVEWIPKWESAQKADPGDEYSAGTWTRDLSIISPAL